MRVLWTVNLIPGAVTAKLGKTSEVLGGWVESMAAQLCKTGGIELGIVCKCEEKLDFCETELAKDALELLKEYKVEANTPSAGEIAEEMVNYICEHEKVVRCKDCKHGYKCEDSEFILCVHPYSDGHKHIKEWYCYDGEKK